MADNAGKSIVFIGERLFPLMGWTARWLLSFVWRSRWTLAMKFVITAIIGSKTVDGEQEGMAHSGFANSRRSFVIYLMSCSIMRSTRVKGDKPLRWESRQWKTREPKHWQGVLSIYWGRNHFMQTLFQILSYWIPSRWVTHSGFVSLARGANETALHHRSNQFSNCLLSAKRPSNVQFLLLQCGSNDSDLTPENSLSLQICLCWFPRRRRNVMIVNAKCDLKNQMS